ncbi:YNL193W-like protein [Saccharomyces kudriavzevii IFO 1802]|uniref:YNL193W-like protein n=2 Tax=Saccharomyces kudriavzevii (strain ATCC MYA-4449 / AS 2.2408 / CBS 8840 / NBRC 1802 / NCYC 2889) TaxID=226230 RepID=J5RR21_SACK1|nr:YNL193W-like protein [Saccharomyces kudriavzevii IFO 1802]
MRQVMGAPRNFKHSGKSKKQKNEQKSLTTQEDFYLAAIECEEQADRWLLSDIKKCLRFYLKALTYYENGLTALGSTQEGKYNIYYNETRLFLQIYTDYLANNGYINILQYVKMDDMPDLSSLTLSLPQITQRFEIVYEAFPVQRTWDLQFNLLTCYLTLIESMDGSFPPTFTLEGSEILNLTNKYIEVFQHLVNDLLQELQNWSETGARYSGDTDADLQRDTLDEDAMCMTRDGTGIRTNGSSEPRVESMDVSEQMTPSSLTEVLVNSLKFNHALMELIVESKIANEKYPETKILNAVQTNFLEDTTKKFYLQLCDIIDSISTAIPLDLKEIRLTKALIQGLNIVTSGTFESLQDLVLDAVPLDDNDVQGKIDLSLIKVDIVEFAISCLKESFSEAAWKLSGLLNKVLTVARTLLTNYRNRILFVRDQELNEQLSHVAFQLCDILVNSSDNELRRYAIKQRNQKSQGTPDGERTLRILMKNANVFLNNAVTISSKPCGLQETIINKLKRNYIHNQAKERLLFLQDLEQRSNGGEDATPAPPTTLTFDIPSDHVFYSNNH